MTITNYTYMAKVELPYLMTGVLGFDCVPCEGDAKVNFGCNTLFSFWCTQKCRYAYSTDSTIDNTSIYPASITQYIYEYEFNLIKHIIILFILTAYLASIDCTQIWDEATVGAFHFFHTLNVLREESGCHSPNLCRSPTFCLSPTFWSAVTFLSHWRNTRIQSIIVAKQITDDIQNFWKYMYVVVL